MKGAKEMHIELCEEWIGIHPITGFNCASREVRQREPAKKKRMFVKELKIWKS